MIVNDHALIDGKKRLGWLATAVFLVINDASVASATNDDVYDLVITVTSTQESIEDIAHRLEAVVTGSVRGHRRKSGNVSPGCGSSGLW